MKMPNLETNVVDQITIKPSLSKILFKATDVTKCIVYLGPRDTKAMYRICFDMEKLGLLKRNKNKSTIYCVFDCTTEYFEFRKSVMALFVKLEAFKKIPPLI